METAEVVKATGAVAVDGAVLGSEGWDSGSLYALVSCFVLSAAKMLKKGSGSEAACGTGWGFMGLGCDCWAKGGGGVGIQREKVVTGAGAGVGMY